MSYLDALCAMAFLTYQKMCVEVDELFSSTEKFTYCLVFVEFKEKIKTTKMIFTVEQPTTSKRRRQRKVLMLKKELFSL